MMNSPDNLVNQHYIIPQHRLILNVFFFFQAEDGIRYLTVTGVQTCALPISCTPSASRAPSGNAPIAASIPRPSPGVSSAPSHAPPVPASSSRLGATGDALR